jgi:hypothetical protein
MIYHAKCVFLEVNESLRGLIMLAALLFIGHQGLGHSTGNGPCFPLAGGLSKYLHQHWSKTTNTAPTTLSATQVANQSTLINAKLYSTCD